MNELHFKRLRDLREDFDLTQKEVAKLLKCSYYTYQRYEYGLSFMTVDKLVFLADYYKVSADYLLGRIDNRRPNR